MKHLIKKKSHSPSKRMTKPVCSSTLQELERLSKQSQQDHPLQATITRVSTEVFLKHLKDNYSFCCLKSAFQSKNLQEKQRLIAEFDNDLST